MEVAKKTKSDAIHPGYGFLSENPEFARRLEKESIILIGPSASAMEVMGSKLAAKETAKAQNIPLVPGSEGAIEDLTEAKNVAREVGFPLLIKASAGGGGKGMRIVEDEDSIDEQLHLAMNEARSAFGDASVFIERYVKSPRHIEIQILADSHGNVVHLFERECSIQRRHQKVVEEAPSSVLTPELRKSMGECAVNLAKGCNYVGAGTVEFLLDDKHDFFFLEMNTRLQVEHPVTELVTGLDLVEWQLQVADGDALPLNQDQISFDGHAIEVRLCAEDPRADFMPQTGEVAHWVWPSNRQLRTDSGIVQGQIISPYYDSMLAKVIGSGPDRKTAINALRSGLSELSLLGVHNNKHFLHNILEKSRFAEGQATTAFLAQEFSDAQYQIKEVAPESIAIAAALFYLDAKAQFKYPSAAWSVAEPLEYTFRLNLEGSEILGSAQPTVKLSAIGSNSFVAKIGEESIEFSASIMGVARKSNQVKVNIGKVAKTLNYAFSKCAEGYEQRLYLDDGNAHLSITDMTYQPAVSASSGGDAEVKAAMDGAIVDVKVKVGDTVERGDVIAVLEAMKMAHQLKAGVSGVVQDVFATVGQQVKTKQIIAVIKAPNEES
ncbi:MAG TPA: 3-methylcrotonyl-CoA carboxylase [Gammaproteobacteria bacterium]|nr:3-methylcrotonyl-CoA carboxylase [Gammaproteobacteria bacterium]